MVTSRGASGEEDLCHSSKFSKDFEATAWADGSAEDTTPHALKVRVTQGCVHVQIQSWPFCCKVCGTRPLQGLLFQ